MGTHPKPIERKQARALRQRGMPMKEIAGRLGVSPSSVSLWTRDIQLSPEQRERNLREAGRRRGVAWQELNRSRRLTYQLEGRERARQGEPLHQAGCMLYWAEGSKERNSVVFANSDVNMTRFFWRYLRYSFGVKPQQISLRLNVYTNNGLSIAEIESHWLSALDLPPQCLRRHMLNHKPTSSSGKKKNKLPYGVCTLTLYDTRIAQHIYGAIQEYAGFEEPRWLDGPPIKPRPRKKRETGPGTG